MVNERFGRCPLSRSRNPFTCGLTGKTFTTEEFHERTDLIARSLAKVTGWVPNDGTPWEKVIAVYSFNTVSLKSVTETPALARKGFC